MAAPDAMDVSPALSLSPAATGMAIGSPVFPFAFHLPETGISSPGAYVDDLLSGMLTPESTFQPVSRSGSVSPYSVIGNGFLADVLESRTPTLLSRANSLTGSRSSSACRF